MPEFRCGGLLFTSKFDSGNLARVERVAKEEEDDTGSHQYSSLVDLKPDYEFNVWTSPDCAGLPCENGNRSWFYFGIRGYAPSRLIKINIMNMNKQGKLYSQGHAPITRTSLPGKNKWERIRDRPTYETVDGEFILRFTHRFSELRGTTTYFAFCYPWAYVESQEQFERLDKEYEHCQALTPDCPDDTIYYHRELLCYSLDKYRMDLITITNCNGLTDKFEPRFDPNLFPNENENRCRKFKGKRVFFLSSRVHPGETPASHVFNGFLEMILRPNDPRAVALRNQYVFKLIPMLNPDGVVRGHYRTDSNGVNLNRVYLDPDIQLHPTIYAAKSLMVYHHVHSRKYKDGQPKVRINFPTKPSIERETVSLNIAPEDSPLNGGYDKCSVSSTSAHSNSSSNYPQPHTNNNVLEKVSSLQHLSFQEMCDKLASVDLTQCSSSTSENADKLLEFLEHEVNIDSDKSPVDSAQKCQMDDVTLDNQDRKSPPLDSNLVENLGNEGSDDEGSCAPVLPSDSAAHLRDPKLLEISPADSGIGFYVDLHGHASKRGCFIYGNYFPEEDKQVENMLFPKLISMNSAHFDFTGCNFTERNMYMKDKRDGASKEGSGRVALHKAIGIIHSYTLECNYNTGRMMNSLAPAHKDDGRATPPPLPGFPPKYTPVHLEEVGRAVAVSALDLNDTNPWSRITLSELNSIYGVQEWVRRYLRSLRGAPRLPRNMTRLANKASSMVATAHSPSNSKPSGSRLATNREATSINNNNGLKAGRKIPASNNQEKSSLKKDLGPVRDHAAARNLTDRTKRRNTHPSTIIRNDQPPVTTVSHAPATVTMSYTTTKDDNPSSSPLSAFSECRLNIPLKEVSAKSVMAFTQKSSSRKLPPRLFHTHSESSMQKLNHPTNKDVASTKQASIWSSDMNVSPRTSKGELLLNDILHSVRPESNASSTFSIEEEKLHQLQMISDTLPVRHKPPGHLVNSKPMVVSRSEPAKKKNVRVLSIHRRSASHSPHSGRGQRKRRGSNTETDSEAEHRMLFKERKKRIIRTRSEGNTSNLGRAETLEVSQVKLSPRPAVNPNSVDSATGHMRAGQRPVSRARRFKLFLPPQIQSLIADDSFYSTGSSTKYWNPPL